MLLQGCAWSKSDKAWWAIYTIVHGIDMHQTSIILEDDRWEEKNPILKNMSSNEATVAMIITWGVVYYLADYFPKYRTPLIACSLAVSVWGVVYSLSNGVRIKF